MPATPSGQTSGVTCITTLTPSVSYSHPDTARSLCSAFSHRALNPAPLARSSLLSPTRRTPHPHLDPRFGRALRRTLPLVARTAR